ncbi:MAG: hypothetical protein ACTH5D_16265 [Halomonas sp.]|uniref:hypothetical protein n=1 Tax=Halomonas sp. TaxID=1486246 RepID=UPI003F90062F
MAELTVGRMAKLYGLHRSSLYEAVDKGRVSAGQNAKGQKVIDLSEMIRVYGPVPNDTRHPTPQKQTPPDTPDSSALLDELRALRAEIASLRDEVHQLRRLPPPSTPEAPKTDAQTTIDTTSADDDPHGLRSLARAMFDAAQREK